MIDETQFGYCDDNMEEIEPKQDWVKKLFQKKPEHLKDHSKRCFNNQQLFKAYMGVFKQRLNQTEGNMNIYCEGLILRFPFEKDFLWLKLISI